jgi:DNA-binding winged helix-turn-helix (wHTH) protein
VPELPDENPPRRFRFAGVEIDPLAYTVRVDGEPRDCSRKAFELLLLMVRNAGTAMPRDQVMDALWPGGQLVSDEALTQLVFRTRAVLGPYGGLLRTLRGVGLRLESEVVAEATVTPAPPLSPDPVPAPEQPLASETVAPAALPRAQNPAPAHPVPRPARRMVQAAALLAVALLLAMLALRVWNPGAVPADAGQLDPGYGLRAEDLRAARPETAALLREALDNEARGERERAAILLENLHASDPGCPVPAIYLAIWSKGAGDRVAAREWLRRARERLGEAPGLYYSLWLAFVEAEIDGGSRAVIDASGAMLDLRPQAWRMRHARAHLMEFMGMRSAALAEIRQIEVPRLGHRKRDMVIADRASMGDVAGAQLMLDRLDPAQDPIMHAFLGGRLAWSRGDWDAAHVGFRRAAGTAFDMARLDLQTRALQYAGAIEVMRGEDAAALASFETARQALAGQNGVAETDLSLSIAQLRLLAGDVPLARRELDRALSRREFGEVMPAAAVLAAWRLFPDSPPERPAEPGPVPAALLEAHEAVHDGNRARANDAVARALGLGAATSRHADELRWLELQLDLPVTPAAAIDPPYPPLSRVVLRREIRRALLAAGRDAGLEQP